MGTYTLVPRPQPKTYTVSMLKLSIACARKNQYLIHFYWERK